MKIPQIVAGAELFDISYIKVDTDSKKRICIGIDLEQIEKGTAWVVGFRKYIIRIARFWSNNILLNCDLAAWPQTAKPYDKQGSKSHW